MGELPQARVRPSSPFERSGVDYAGPIHMRLTKTRDKGTMKGYIAIFICTATRAVHIEVVEDYTREAFIATFHRFTSRRGFCKELYSDQGTNFVGADALLRQMVDASSEFSSRVVLSLAQEGTSWIFNPPSAPHFGGIWEAAVKSAKHHLRCVIGDQVLTFSELATLMCRIEVCLNSRPLTTLNDDPSDIDFLSPSHFLIQRSSFIVPEGDVTNDNVSAGKRWLLISQLTQHFWARWSNEYLTSLQSRTKWKQPQPPVTVGELVLVLRSICARLPQFFDAPSPRSYVFTLLSEVRSTIRRRWAECSGFNVTPTQKAFSSAPAVQRTAPARGSSSRASTSSSTEPGSPHSSIATRRSPSLHRTTRRPTAGRCAEQKFSSRATAGETAATYTPRGTTYTRFNKTL